MSLFTAGYPLNENQQISPSFLIVYSEIISSSAYASHHHSTIHKKHYSIAAVPRHHVSVCMCMCVCVFILSFLFFFLLPFYYSSSTRKKNTITMNE